jgi:hypothetical protein
MNIEDFIKRTCKFAAPSLRLNEGDFPYPYGPDENPYEDQLFKMEVEYNPTTQTLTLIPYTGYRGEEEERRLQIQLTDAQAKVLDVFEDKIHQEHTEHVNDANSEALVAWGEEYARQNGFGKEPFVFHDKKDGTISIYPDNNDPTRTYRGQGLDLPESQVMAEVKLAPLPTKRVWRQPPPKPIDTEA